MWSPATWTWRAALTCVLLETVLHGVRGRLEKTRCSCNQSCVGTTHEHANAMDMQTQSVCSLAPMFSASRKAFVIAGSGQQAPGPVLPSLLHLHASIDTFSCGSFINLI